ncbi:Maff2 family mobile element protein [Ethanoligenens sp.]
MSFISSAMGTLEVIVIALGAGLAVWGGVNLMEGYGGDNAAANAQIP